MKNIILLLMLFATLTSSAADKKYTDLTLLPAASIATGDVLSIVDVSANETKKTRILDLDIRYQSAVLTNGHILVGNASNVAADVTMSGDVLITNAGVTSIDVNRVTNSMLAQIATASLKGRVTGGTGNVEDLTGTQATTLLDAFTSGLKGLAPASGGGSTNYLRADGTWVAPPGTLYLADGNGLELSTLTFGLELDGSTLSKSASGLKVAAGNITSTELGSNSVTTIKVTDANITNAKLADMTAATIKGRASGAGTGVPTDLSATQATAILDAFTSGAKGLAPASGGGSTNFLRADGTWTAPTASSVAQVYRSVTTTDSPTSADDFLALSGSSFTVTLPTAVGYTKPLCMKHFGSSISNVYQINTTAGQTVNLLASGAVKLYTYGEKFCFFSNNANWLISEHDTDTDWSTPTTWEFSATSAYVYTVTAANATVGAIYSNSGFNYTVSTTIAGTTTLTCSGNGTPAASGTLTKVSGTGDASITFSSRTITGVPVKGASPTTDFIMWKREGRAAHIYGRLEMSGTSGAAAGSGDYVFVFPNSLSHDLTVLDGHLTVEGSGSWKAIGMIGQSQVGTSSNDGTGPVLLYDATHFRLAEQVNGGSNGVVNSAYFAINIATAAYNVDFYIYPTGWLP